jgi:predicted RNase H-like HicB family nuclease
MNKVLIKIERIKDHYSVYAENVEGIYGGGDTVAEAKKSIEEAIKLLKKYNKPENIPAILKSNYELVFRFDDENFMSKQKVKIDIFSAHEVLDRSYVIADIIQHMLLDHPVVKKNKELKKKVQQAQNLITEVYQEAANLKIN